MCTWEIPYVLHPISEKFPQCHLPFRVPECRSDEQCVCLILVQYIVRYCPVLYSSPLGSWLCFVFVSVVSQAPQHFGPCEVEASYDSCFQSFCHMKTITCHIVNGNFNVVFNHYEREN